MLDLISYFVFGTWAGYISRRLYGKIPSKGIKITFAGIFVIAAIALLIVMGISENATARWTAFGVFGFYFAFGFEEPRMGKLSKTWAGIWLLLLFIAIEYARTVIVASYLTNVAS